MPVALPLWALASLRIARQELRALLGEPHYVETDPRRTCGGEEDGWAYVFSSGQRILITHEGDWAALYSNLPDLGPILDALKIAPDDPRLALHDPVAMR
jgi:hypothetical protein